MITYKELDIRYVKYKLVPQYAKEINKRYNLNSILAKFFFLSYLKKKKKKNLHVRRVSLKLEREKFDLKIWSKLDLNCSCVIC
jgi:hypothetical protein